jgi:hypothetical protein
MEGIFTLRSASARINQNPVEGEFVARLKNNVGE